MNRKLESGSEPAVGLRIFVVENHEDTLIGMTHYLEQMGHTVFSAMNVQDALATLPKTPVDVLLSDIGLPDGTGWELLERAHLPDSVFTIAMSGFGMRADRARSSQAGYRRHLLKPFDPAELDGLLSEASKLHQSEIPAGHTGN